MTKQQDFDSLVRDTLHAAVGAEHADAALVDRLVAGSRDPLRRLPALSRRRGWTRPALAAAAVAAIALGTAAIAHGNFHRHGASPGSPSGQQTSSPTTQPTPRCGGGSPDEPTLGPSGTIGTSNDPNFASTLAAVQRTLQQVPSLPASRRVRSSPAAALDCPTTIQESANWIDRASFWTTPGTAANVIAYFTTHPPDGMTLTSRGTISTGQGDIVELIGFGSALSSAATPGVTVSVTPLADGVGIRIDATAVWQPTKPGSERIGTVTSVDVTVTRGTSTPTVSRTLEDPAAQRLADAVDRLSPEAPGVRSCPNDQGFTDALVFHSSGRTVNVVNHVGGCGGVSVTVNGVEQPDLAGSVDAQVLAALGLPANYGE
jgi:hypothetical protein